MRKFLHTDFKMIKHCLWLLGRPVGEVSFAFVSPLVFLVSVVVSSENFASFMRNTFAYLHHACPKINQPFNSACDLQRLSLDGSLAASFSSWCVGFLLSIWMLRLYQLFLMFYLSCFCAFKTPKHTRKLWSPWSLDHFERANPENMQQCSNPFLDLWVGDCRESCPTQYNDQYIGVYHENLKGTSETIIMQEIFGPMFTCVFFRVSCLFWPVVCICWHAWSWT